MKKEIRIIDESKVYTIGRYLKENKESFNRMIDFTMLRDNATIDEIKKTCETAEENGYYAVCIRPEFVSTAKAFCKDTKIVTVVSFPKGDDKTIEKVREADKAMTDGADEIDVCLNVPLLKSLNDHNLESEEYSKIYADLLDDIRQIVSLCHKEGVIVKVIIESGDLTYDETKTACEICVEAGSDFVKTSTGMAKSGVGAEIDKVKYMRKILPDFMRIKASGGVRSEEQIKEFAPFVDRIGTSTVVGY